MRVLEFFAGGGMVHAALPVGLNIAYANDIDAKKAASYRTNWPGARFDCTDIADVAADNLPDADITWASFPCQDVSLAGLGGGMDAQRSGTYWQFHRLLKDLRGQHRAPPLVMLENVCGLLTSSGGRDFRALCASLRQLGYRVGALVINADQFVPQSRPRLFVIGLCQSLAVPSALTLAAPHKPSPWHPSSIAAAHAALPAEDQTNWVWWHLPTPREARPNLRDVMLPAGDASLDWHGAEKTQRLLAMMSPAQHARVQVIVDAGAPATGFIYLRTRRDAAGRKVQRAEARFDGLAGCLRTAAGGSSRQIVLQVDGSTIKTRLLAPREGARLMGLPDDYALPGSYYDAFKLLGDGVAVPVVRHLLEHLALPLLQSRRLEAAA